MPVFPLARISPYEHSGVSDGGGAGFSSSDEKGYRLARPDPIYESLFGPAAVGMNGGIGGRQPLPPMMRTLQHSDSAATAAALLAAKPAAAAVPDRPQVDTDVFNIMNSFWFMIASLVQQGTDILPRLVFFQLNDVFF